MRLARWTLFMAGALLLVDADQAFAWGPATHIGLASSILERLAFLPAAIGAILARHGVSYLYGNIAADVVFAKRWSRVKQSCHHWTTGFALLDSAPDDRARAFAYGYLSHLAADTVAHGKFIPRQILTSEVTVNFGHFYWELRADTIEAESRWKTLDQLMNASHCHLHYLLERHITGTFLPYELNRLLFGGINGLAMRKGFRRTMHAWDRYSRWYLCPKLLNEYHAESLDRIYAILFDGRQSSLLREDPNGTSALMHVRVRRRELRRRRRRGAPVGQRILESSRDLAPHRPHSSSPNSRAGHRELLESAAIP